MNLTSTLTSHPTAMRLRARLVNPTPLLILAALGRLARSLTPLLTLHHVVSAEGMRGAGSSPCLQVLYQEADSCSRVALYQSQSSPENQKMRKATSQRSV